MKVARWYNNRDIRIEEMPEPAPGPGEMRVTIHACGICGSDIVEWYRLPRAPLVPGHEIGGEVAAVGSGVTGFKPGDRVFVAPKVPCMKCDYCRKGHYPVCAAVPGRLPGGFAESVLVPEALVREGTRLLPDTVTYDQATFIEPLACVVRAHRLAEVRSGDTVLVIGCGMSGLLHVKLAKSNRCRVIAVDINRNRLAVADRFGADLALHGVEDADRLAEEMKRKKADVVFLCTSAMSAIDQAWQSVDKGGAVVFFAVPEPGKEVRVPANEFWTKEIRILTAYYCGPPDIDAALSLIETRRIVVDDMITHRLPLHEIRKGYELVLEANHSIKVIILPNQES